MRSVLIASIVGLAVNIVINVGATFQGWLNAKRGVRRWCLRCFCSGAFMNSHSVCSMNEVSCARSVLVSCTVLKGHLPPRKFCEKLIETYPSRPTGG